MMKTFVVLLAFSCGVTSLLASMYVNRDNYSFSYYITKFGECRVGEDRLRIFLNVSIAECVTECVTRAHCLALSFSRQMNACEMFGSEEGSLFNRGRCIYVTRSAIKHIMLPCTDCQNGESCDVATSVCVRKECSEPLSNIDKYILGNGRRFGDEIRYLCNTGFRPTANRTETATCQKSGTWNHESVSECDKGVLFKVIAGSGSSSVDAWMSGTGATTDVKCGHAPYPDCRNHYRSPLVDHWEQLNPQKIRYTIYKDGVDVAWVLFNATASTKMDWFHKSRIISSSYSDLTSSSIFNHFAIGPGVLARQFYVSAAFNGCNGDTLHLAIFDAHDPCSYGQGASYPLIFFSTLSTVVVSGDTDHIGYADIATVDVLE